MENNNFQLYRQKAKLAIDRYYRVRKDMKISFKEGRVEEIETLAAPFLKGYFTLAVIGKMSSGKSTFINAFLKNGKLLPTGVMQTTCTITEIIPSQEKKLEITYYNNDTPHVYYGEEIYEILDKTVKIPEEFSELPVNKINSMLCDGYNMDTILEEKEIIEKETDLQIEQDLLEKYISSSTINNIPTKIVIYHPLEGFDGWKIIDTPGINADGGIEDTTWNLLEGNNDIESNNVDAIIFVHNGNQSPQDKATRESIKDVFEKLTSEARRRMFFVITHASERNFINNKDRFIDYFRNQFKQYGVDDNKIIPVDSLLELLERWCNENKINTESLTECYDELIKDFHEEDCDAMIGIVDIIKQLIRKEHKEFNSENINNKISEIVGFPFLRKLVNDFVKTEKKNTYKKLINTIKGDLNNLKKKKNEEREILNNKCTMSPEKYIEDIDNRINELKRLSNNVAKEIQNISIQYSISYIAGKFKPILDDFDKNINNLHLKSSIKQIANLYKNQIEGKQKLLVSEISSKFIKEFERSFESESCFFPLIDTDECLKKATTKTLVADYKDDNSIIGRIKRLIPFAPKSFGRIRYTKTVSKENKTDFRNKVKSEFHLMLQKYCTNIYLQICKYAETLILDLDEKLKQRKSELNDLQELQAIDSENFKRIKELNDEIEYINIHLEELENDTCI